MNSNARNASIARLEKPSGPPNAVIAKGRNRGKNSKCYCRLGKNGLDSLGLRRLGFSSLLTVFFADFYWFFVCCWNFSVSGGRSCLQICQRCAPAEWNLREIFRFFFHNVFDVKFWWNFPSHTQTLENVGRKISPKFHDTFGREKRRKNSLPHFCRVAALRFVKEIAGKRRDPFWHLVPLSMCL